MHQNPRDVATANAELMDVEKYKIKHQCYVEFLQQKLKMTWVKDGDENSKIFYQSIRARRIQNHVYAIYDEHGNWQDSSQSVPAAFLDFYQELLGTRCDSRRQVVQQIMHSGPLLTEEHRAMLERPFSVVEIKDAFFSIPSDKSPWPDGFSVHFYKDTWGYCGSRYH